MRRKLATLVSTAGLLCTLTLSAGIVLAANPSADLDQCANGTTAAPDTTPCQSSGEWVNGNLGASKAHYNEGDSVPYRMRFTNLTPGASYTVVIKWDTSKSSKHALDYLTTFNRTLGPNSTPDNNANPVVGVSGLALGTYAAKLIPADPQITGFTPIAGEFRLWGAAFTASPLGPYSYPDGTGFVGDKSAQLSIPFTPTVSNPVLAWGGHIASHANWGDGNSAVAISGSPFHMSLVGLNGAGGSQDRSLSNDAVTFPSSITIIKASNASGTFDFTGSPSPVTNFSLTYPSPATKLFGNITTFQTYVISETVPSGWDTPDRTCAVSNSNGGSYTIPGTGVSIVLKEGETWSCTFTNYKLDPVINVVKSSTTTSITAAGQSVPYTFTVTNPGNVTLTGITVVDAKCNAAPAYQSGDANTDGKLQATETWIYTCSHTVTQGEVDAGGNLHNLVTADSVESAPDTDTKDIPVSQGPLINVVKSSTTTSITAAGQSVPYTFTVTNPGNVTLTGITVVDAKCNAAPAYQSGDANTDGKLQATETWIYTCSHTVTQGEVDAGGNLHNLVTADSVESAPDTDTKDIPVSQNPHLSITKVATEADYDAVGDVIHYTIVATNDGNVTLGAVTVSDPNVGNLVCTPANGSSLAPTATMSCTASHTVTQPDINAGHYANQACVNDGPGGAAQQCADEDVPADQNPALEVVKVDDSEKFDVGDVINYTITVTNTGNVTLTGVSVTDANAVGLDCDPDTANNQTTGFTIAVGAHITCTASHTATQPDLNAGSYFNQACATATGGTSDCGDVTTPAKAIPGINTADYFVPQDEITMSGIAGASPTGDLYVELRIDETCGQDGSPAWSHTFDNVTNTTYKTVDAGNTTHVSLDATIRWCTSYSGDANNAARPLLSRSEIASIDFDPEGVLAFGAGALAMLAYSLWSRRRRPRDD